MLLIILKSGEKFANNLSIKEAKNLLTKENYFNNIIIRNENYFDFRDDYGNLFPWTKAQRTNLCKKRTLIFGSFDFKVEKDFE